MTTGIMRRKVKANPPICIRVGSFFDLKAGTIFTFFSIVSDHTITLAFSFPFRGVLTEKSLDDL
jgi:hypothetical protein